MVHLTIFGLKNAKINFFEEKKDLSAVFIESKFGLLQICLSDMKKHETLEKLLRAGFFMHFQNIALFEIVEKSSEAHAKIIEIILFWLNMVEQLERVELIHFATTVISPLPHTSGFNVKLKTPIL